MMNDRQNARMREIFANALEAADARERDAYLAQACGDDATLRVQVDALLEAHRQSRGFMDELNQEAQPAGQAIGSVIGRYRLLEEIGEGGFGVVYRAEQLEPVRRQVALKIIKPGMDTREVVARFEAERQALALMDHPNIAKVFDGGAIGAPDSQPSTPNSQLLLGRPYFVMELVPGLPITDFCDRKNLSPGDRLQLFLKVCRAVQHAHQKGVIHRDLKPSNILVTEEPGEAIPKVIDFGVAKALGQKLTEKTLFTRLEQMIGTPAYMSPEQAGLGGLDLDTRTDIYTLGVVLYELLTGTTPVQRETLHQAALEEVRRVIREIEPPKPSNRLTTLGAKLTEVAQHRHTEPSALAKLVRGDLDWIVMKALEKDRRRRYDTAEGLAQDLERYQNHEPVSAGPPSKVYRVGKFVRRHGVGVAMAGVVSVAFLTGLALALVGFSRATNSEKRAKAEAKRASEQAAIAQAVRDFLRNDLLTRADPEHEPNRQLTVRALLDQAATNMQGRFDSQPLVEADIRSVVGAAYFSLGEYSNAEPHFQRALELLTRERGKEHHDTLDVARQLANLLQFQGRNVEAEEILRKTLATQRRVFGPQDTNTLMTMTLLGAVCSDLGMTAEAEQLVREALDNERRTLGVTNRNTLDTMHTLAGLCTLAGKLKEAEKLYAEFLETTQRIYGPEHPQTLAVTLNLAVFYNQSGQLESAERLFREVWDIGQRVLSPEHPLTLSAMNDLGHTFDDLGRDSEAEQLYLEVVSKRNRVLGPNHPDTILSIERLAEMASWLGHWQLAWKQYQALFQVRSNDFMVAADGVVDGWLAGDAAGCRALCSAMIERFGQTTNATAAMAVAGTCLLFPDSLPSLEPVFALADRLASAEPGSVPFRTVKGMAEYRRGRWSEAVEWLTPPRDTPPTPNLLGDYFLAMAKHRLQATEAAQSALARAKRTLSPARDFVEWHPRLRALIVRREAEVLIYGHEVSPALNAESLAGLQEENRFVWERLNAAGWLVMHQRWPEARDACLQALADPGFAWPRAEQRNEMLPLEMACALLMAGDYEAHERICRQVFASEPDTFGREHAEVRVKMWLVRPRDRSPDLTRQALDFAHSIPESTNTWECLTRGIAAYRQGDYAKAGDCLNQARRSQDIGCQGAATLYLAMSEQQMGRPAEAARLLHEAEALLRDPLLTFTGSAWYDLCVCALAREEARQLLGQTNPPAPEPSGARR